MFVEISVRFQLGGEEIGGGGREEGIGGAARLELGTGTESKSVVVAGSGRVAAEDRELAAGADRESDARASERRFNFDSRLCRSMPIVQINLRDPQNKTLIR
jgi:hypothetical protein